MPLYLVAKSHDYVTVRVEPFLPLDRYSQFAWYKDGVWQGQTTSTVYTYINLAPRTTYVFSCDGYYLGGDTPPGWYGQGSIVVTTDAKRPDYFYWSNPKRQGQPFNVYAYEWNAFLNKINEFRDYKGLSRYPFTMASSGAVFTASMFNEAVYAIRAMSPPISPPPTVQRGDPIYAYYFDLFISSLFSIP